MAGDWIKVEKATARKPEIFGIAAKLSIKLDHAFALCIRFWIWCDDQITDGNAKCVTPELLDDAIGVTRFSESLVDVGWLQVRNGSLVIPNFDRHLSESAKTRCETNRRVAKSRKKRKQLCNENDVTYSEQKPLPEKRREETSKKNPKKDSSSEPPSTETQEPLVMNFPVVGDSKTWGLTQSKIDEYSASYPGVDVLTECRKARQWAIDNSTRQKTAKGMPAFLNKWMSRQQNEFSRSPTNANAHGGKNSNETRFESSVNALALAAQERDGNRGL